MYMVTKVTFVTTVGVMCGIQTISRGGGSGVADVAVAIPMSNKVGLSHTINWR